MKVSTHCSREEINSKYRLHRKEKKTGHVSSVSHCANSYLNAFFASSLILVIGGYCISKSAEADLRGSNREEFLMNVSSRCFACFQKEICKALNLYLLLYTKGICKADYLAEESQHLFEISFCSSLQKYNFLKPENYWQYTGIPWIQDTSQYVTKKISLWFVLGKTWFTPLFTIGLTKDTVSKELPRSGLKA